jgi:hypothetical protein
MKRQDSEYYGPDFDGRPPKGLIAAAGQMEIHLSCPVLETNKSNQED